MRPSRSSAGGGPRAQARGVSRTADGYSLVECLVVAGVVAGLLVVTVPALDRAADTLDTAAAARYLAAQVASARFDAARRQRAVAVRFRRTAPVSFDVVADGDGDGVTAADVTAGIDPVIRQADRLEDHFPRARFGIAATVPAIDDTGVLSASDDPVRAGAADQLSLSPMGTSNGGTLYVSGRGGAQFAVRVAGVTGRARVLRFDPGRRAWRPY